MNEQDPKSPEDYARELKERQRLFGHDSGKQITPGLSYITHKTGDPHQYILEYAGGRRILVEIDEVTGKEHFLREL